MQQVGRTTNNLVNRKMNIVRRQRKRHDKFPGVLTHWGEFYVFLENLQEIVISEAIVASKINENLYKNENVVNFYVIELWTIITNESNITSKYWKSQILWYI